MTILVYLAALVAANLSVARFGPSASVINALLFIGLDLTLRDRLHDAWQGRWLWPRMLLLVAAAGLVSYVLNANAGRIALASCLAFALAALGDAAVYQLARRSRWLVRANASNLMGAAIDSLTFPALAFGGFLPAVVVGQFLAKTLGGLLWSILLAWGRQRLMEEPNV